MSNPDPYSPHPIADGQATLSLDSWALLQVAGDDAETFLQGQLSADMRKLGAGQACWATYSSPKGRMLAVLRAERHTDASFRLRLPATLAESVAKRLRMFVLRSKVTIAVEPATRPEADAAERLALIRAGIPVVYPQTQDRWVAQMANLDRLGGISFDKGCYTGQEVIARLHYLGNLKKRLHCVRGAGAAPEPGMSIVDRAGDGQAVGDIVDAVAEGEGFVASAVLQLGAAARDTLSLERDTDAALLRPRAYDDAEDARG